MEKSKKLPLWLRWWGLGNGAITFFWLPVEDVGTGFISVLAGVWCAWIGSLLWWRFADRWEAPFRGVAVGGTSGALFFPVALVLVVLKAGIHAHGFSEYSNYELGTLLDMTPWMVLGGVVCGGLISFLSEKYGENGDSGQNV